MAKREKRALYENMVACTYPVVDERGDWEDRFFRPDTGGDGPRVTHSGKHSASESFLEVPQGELVCKHFIPANEIAEDDREDQINNPEEYVDTKRDIRLIAELQDQQGFYKPVYKNVNGKQIKMKTEVMVGVEVLTELCNEKLDEEVTESEDVAKERAIMDLVDRADNDKERRKTLCEILKEGDIPHFRGADPEALASKVYDSGLYKKGN